MRNKIILSILFHESNPKFGPFLDFVILEITNHARISMENRIFYEISRKNRSNPL